MSNTMTTVLLAGALVTVGLLVYNHYSKIVPVNRYGLTFNDPFVDYRTNPTGTNQWDFLNTTIENLPEIITTF